MKTITKSTKDHESFSEFYLSVRQKEGFLMPDELVKELPEISSKHPQYSHWQLRKINSRKFCSYIKNKPAVEAILELGCGNGWFANQIATSTKAEVLGMDVNVLELEQAERNFNQANLSFAFGDIFKCEFTHLFDVIVMNASVQYFSNFQLLIHRLKGFLKEEGEIHILDSFFYGNEKEMVEAKRRTERYYKEMDEEKMISHYYHHRVEDLKDFDVMSRKKGKLSFLKRELSPFGWYRLQLGQ